MSETVDITKIEDRRKIVDTLSYDIDAWSQEEFDDGHRNHLGASLIGKPCSRELWYGFRWAEKQDFSSGKRSAGQTLRLFQRGHREEYSIIQYLEGIGCNFEATPETQIRISDIEGHFGGSLDNVGTLPQRYGIHERILFEFKTANLSSFNKTKKQGIQKTQPVHYSQMCTYGFKANLNYGLYLIVHKDSDEIYMELIELDHEHGKSMIDKAAMVITSKTAPPQYSQTPTSVVCGWCNFSEICHNNKPVEKNCRSCQNSTPAEGGNWVCDIAPAGQNIIPKEVIEIGCPSHKGIR